MDKTKKIEIPEEKIHQLIEEQIKNATYKIEEKVDEKIDELKIN